MSKQTNKDSVATAASVEEIITGILVDILRSKDSKDFRYHFPLALLPWEDDNFRMKLIQVACGGITWRSSSSLKILPANGGLVDLETFVRAVMALDFRGDDKPNDADKKEAKKILNSIESGMYEAEAAAAQIKKQYGWDIEPTPDGFARHEMLKRLKASAAKGTTVALDVL